MKTKTRILLIMLSMMALLSVRAQSPGFEWAAQSGGEYQIWGNSIAVDPYGNQVITGCFQGTADFDPGPGNLYLTANGENDMFIQKLDPDGALIWAFSIGGIKNDNCLEVVTDGTGNIYLTGYFMGTVDADPGPGQYWLYAPDYRTTMVLKLDPDGGLIWARQFGDGITGASGPGSIAVDHDLNVITVGYFIYKVDFDPGPGTFFLTSTVQDNIGDDYVHKMDAAGNFIWVKQLKGKDLHYIKDVMTDAAGGIIYCGRFKGTVDFDPSVKGKFNLTSGAWENSFIGKLTSSGDFAWAKMIYSTSQNTANALAHNPDGDLHVAGWLIGTADFDPGSGVFNMTADGWDAYILKLTSTGDFIWAKHLGDLPGGIGTDASGNVYLNGSFSSACDLDPGAGVYLLTSYGQDDSFIYKCDPAGDFLWVTQTGGTGYDASSALYVSPDGYVYAVGNFSDVVDFNPEGNGIYEMTNTGEPDIFLQKLNPDGGSLCPIPDGLTVQAVGETTATLAWNAVTGATGYYVAYRDLLTNDWIVSGPVEGTSLVLNNLVAMTGYEFRVKTDCMSNYSYAVGFFTSGGCIDEYEPNEMAGEAAPMAVNSTIYATIGSPTDQDWFSFSTNNTEKNFRITLTDLTANFDLYLCKPDGNSISQSHNPGTEDEIITWNPRKGGSYTIQVYGSQGAYDPVNCYTLILEVSSTQYKSAEADITIEELLNDMAIYPNPASSTLEIELTSVTAGNAELALFNTNGQAILKNYFKVSEGENHLRLDVSGISSGLYMFRLVADNEVITRKVMIMH